MSGVLFWSECMEEVYGKIIDFENENDFIKIVKLKYKEYNNKECEVLSIEIETCICTEMGIKGDSIIPIKLTDIVIENFYIADVIATNESERKCRVCGCTWNNACEGGCYWVEENLCSKCHNEVI